MSEQSEEIAGRLASRGREALIDTLRPAFHEAASAHADLLQLSDEQLEQMIQSAADRADGLQWRRALAAVASEELGISLGEALIHPAVARAQTLVGAPSYEESLANLRAELDDRVSPPAEQEPGNGGARPAARRRGGRSRDAPAAEPFDEPAVAEPFDEPAVAELAEAPPVADPPAVPEVEAEEEPAVEAQPSIGAEPTVDDEPTGPTLDGEPTAPTVEPPLPGAEQADPTIEGDAETGEAPVLDPSAETTSPASVPPPASSSGEEAASPEAGRVSSRALRFAAVHINGIANLEPDEGGLELRLSPRGLDINRSGGDILGRVSWREIRSLDVTGTRGLRRRRRQREVQLLLRTRQGEATFQVPDLTAEELSAQLAPLIKRHLRRR